MTNREIKKELKRLRARKRDYSAGSKERIEIHQEMQELKKKLLEINKVDPEKEKLIKEIYKVDKLAKQIHLDLKKFTVEELSLHLTKFKKETHDNIIA